VKFLACCVLPDKKIYGKYLYWLNILYWNFFHPALENRVCREIFHCIEYIFYHSGFLRNLRLPSNTEFALKIFTVLNILLHSGFLSNLTLPWKTKRALNSLYWIYIFKSFKIFERLALALKNRVALKFFTALKYFYHSGFLSNLRLPWKKRVALKCFTVLKYVYRLGFLSNLRLPWKQDLHWIHCIEYIFFIIQDFWATCACPENTSWPDIFHCIQIFLSVRIFEQLALALKTEFALNSLYWIYIFYHSGFLSNLRLPWNFSGRGGDRPPASYAYVGNSCLRWTACFNRVSRLCKIYWTRFNSKILCLDSGILSRSVTGIDLLDHCCRARHKSSNQKSWLESSDIESLTRISNLL